MIDARDDLATSRATRVVQLARDAGFDDVGIADARAPLPHKDALLASVDEGRHGPLAWLKDSMPVRADVRAFMPEAKSVVVVVKSYYAGDHDEHVDERALAEHPRVSRYAWGSDYHNGIRRKLRKLRKRVLQEIDPEARISPFVDDKPVAERAWAREAGLGFVGKSAMFIHRGFGTWTFLGGLVTSIELTPPLPPIRSDLCGTCTRCLEACPTGAITAPFTVDAARCLTTWNVEEPLDPRADAPALVGHGWAVGCDVCQEVCPWNRFEQRSDDPRFLPRPGHVVVDPRAPPDDLLGTPLARPGSDGLARAAARAARRR